MSGYRAVFSRRFTKSKLWDICRHYGCTSFALIGGIATAVYSEPARPDDADNPVRMVVSGGMPPAIWEPFEQRFGVDVLEFYGASDGGGMAYKPVGHGPRGSFGKPMPGILMKILDPAGHECQPGVIGEICCRPDDGSAASVEYFNNPQASRKKIADGWNRSGDMGWADHEGWLYFAYRKGGGLRHNGEFINPDTIEKLLAEDATVDDVFVYGVPAASGAPGEKDIVAAIVPVDPASFSPRAVFERCSAALEGNCVPAYLQVVEHIPKTASEKPQERILLESFAVDAANVYGQ
jgi:crotonobetaine/carnitine-CoA ligase